MNSKLIYSGYFEGVIPFSSEMSNPSRDSRKVMILDELVDKIGVDNNRYLAVDSLGKVGIVHIDSLVSSGKVKFVRGFSEFNTQSRK